MSCFWTRLVNAVQRCESTGVRLIVPYEFPNPIVTGGPEYLVVGDPATLVLNGETSEWDGADAVTTLRVTRLIYCNSAPDDFYNCGGDPLSLIPGSDDVPGYDGEPDGAYQFFIGAVTDVAVDEEVGWFINPEGGPANGPDRVELSTLLGEVVGEGTVVVFATDDLTGRQYAGAISFTSCV